MEPAQVGAKAECGQCGKTFQISTEPVEVAATMAVKVSFDDEPKRSNLTISAYMREHGVDGDVSLLESFPPTATPEQVQEWKRARYQQWLKGNGGKK